jgi:hypothetical protein
MLRACCTFVVTPPAQVIRLAIHQIAVEVKHISTVESAGRPAMKCEAHNFIHQPARIAPITSGQHRT